ncbi:MAG: hypothetical protein U9N85_01365, partial [Bacteroidota bacterium]|nr:hypothetical protein [Bacteroidota bacterium]
RNPLFDIRNYCLKNNTRDFTVAQFSEYLRKSPTTVKNRLIGLWYKGFLTYNEELQSVHVKQKLFNHVAYYLQTEDYDIIQIESPDRKFIKAEYNLKNNTLILDSIERVILSNLKRTAIKPAGKRVVVKKDRNMELKGTLQSGRAVFFKGTYKFNYKDFLIKIDSAEKLFYHEPAPVYSKIEHIKNSTVFIDSTNNRSGINGRETRHYPIYKSPEKSFVYYDSSTKHSKNDFYFEVYPHTVPDLRRISGTSLFLKGKMTTGSVLPPFEDTLSIQYDTELITDKNGRKKKVPVASLGFLHELGNDSVPLFGKGALKKNAEGKSLVRLSRAGLRGEGQIEWLTSVMQADSFNFHPNSLTADAANFRISESIDDEKYPVLKAEDVEIEWDAENETIVCNTKKEGQKIYIYEGKISMEGTTTYTPDYLSGSGIAEYKNTQVTSDSIVFTENSFYADNSTFVSFEPGSNKEVKEIEIYHMKSYTDMKADKTAFEATDSAYVDIESNQFYTYPKFMTWDHKSRTADINRALNHHTNSDYSVDPVLMDSTYMVDVVKFSPGSIYGSTDSLLMRSKKDSLQFYGTDALFESKLKNLTIKKIKRIDVADISIIPSSDLVIKADGKINKLKSTRLEVLSDSNVVVHEITNVDINIKSKDKYNASSGTYKYRDITGKDQNVYFKTIIYDEMKGATVANGHISEKRNFTLSPYYYFKGDVEFNAKKDLLDFDGFAKMKPFCNYNTDWFFFKDEINPKKVIIPLNKDLRSDSTKLRANVYADIKQAKDSFSIVPVFFKTAPGTQQGSIYSARNADYGTRYDVGKNQYIVAPLADLMQGNSPTDYITYNTKHCVIETKGKLNYANIQNVKFIAGGSSLYDLKSKRFRMESFTILDFHFDKSLMTLIAETVNAQQPSQPISVDDKLTGIMKLAVGEDIQQQYLSNLSTNKILPSPLNNRFVFSQLKFYWEEEVGAFKSSGKVGILSIDGTHINEYATVKMQVTKAYGYDEVKLYIKANDEWFYFRFFGSQLHVYSSNAIFNKTVEDTGFGKRKDPDSKLRYLTTNKGGVQSFLESF